MSVYPERRKNKLTGKWIAEVTHLGKRRRDRFDTQKEGEQWEGLIKLTGVAPVKAGADAVVAHPFGTVVKEALVSHPGWAGNRDPSRQQRLTYAVDVLGAATPIEAIVTADFDKLVTSLKKRPGYEGRKRLSAGTINRYLALVSAVIDFAVGRDYRPGKPRVPWQEEDGQRIHWLTEAQEEAVRAVIRKEGRKDEELAVRVLTRSGLRWSEFATLEPRQVFIEGAEAWIKLDRTKTDTPRDVPIDPKLAGELLKMIERNAVPAYYTFRDTLHRAAKSVGQNLTLTPHILRHTTATRLVRAGVNLAIVQKFMGHSSIQTTLKYTHVAEDDLQQALKKLSPHAGQSEDSPKSNVIEMPIKSREVEATPGIEPGYTVLQTDL